MAKNPFFPRTYRQQYQWLITFNRQLPQYASKYGIPAAEVTATNNDTAWYKYWFEAHVAAKHFSKSLTAFKTEATLGLPEGNSASTVPVPPVFGAVPAAVAPGIFKRVLSIANRIKSHSSYTLADGEALGLEGTAQTAIDKTTLRPTLKLFTTATGVTVKWKKGKARGIEIWVKRGAGNFEFLAMDYTPNYLDTHPLPATAEVWQYKGMYHAGDARAGNWSEVVSIMVS